ncbi:MAG: biotin--[acetyl-CoA-carboxylase] ligase [Chloroflexota bacterium]
MPAVPSRLVRLDTTPSTQDVVRGLLEAGTPEVCVAVADAQSAGRGRLGRTWTAPPGAALLVSAGFRPVALAPQHAWRVAATAALAMLDAAEEVAGLRDASLALKWPNDIVADGPDGRLLKVAGVLGESVIGADGLASVIVGIGVNAGWRPEDFPSDLAPGMTSLLALSGGRPIDRDALLEAWLARLEPRYAALCDGRFDAGTWSVRQRTTGRRVEVATGDATVAGIAGGVDPERGDLLLVDERTSQELAIGAGEVTRCRIVTLPERRARPGGV